MPSIDHLSEAGVLERILPLLGVTTGSGGSAPAPAASPGRSASGLENASELEIGPGDDAAVLRLASRRLVITTDTLSEGTDFLLPATSPERIGRKAAVQNIADIAAMGARPRGVVIALSAPSSTSIELLEGISRGLAEVCERYGVRVLGGDLGAAEQLIITVTAVGDLAENAAAVRRDGARPGDVLAIGSPRLGRSGAGLAAILAGRHEDAAFAEVVDWHNAPDPDLTRGWTSAAGRASAMLDVSDGLVRDARRLAAASGVVLDLDAAALTADAESLAEIGRLLDVDPQEWVLHGGEEHALLATFPDGTIPDGFRPIGRVLSASDEHAAGAVLRDGIPVAGSGWDHFS